jgi:bifunctional DNA-binding transcriptional regulator/antitoxin component of YhaV-PrlF toxin-antitoxin module
MNSYVVELEEDEYGYLILPLPEDLLRKMGWREGDTIKWHDNGDGSYSLTKKKAQDA